MDNFFDVAKEAASKAGEFLLKNFGRARDISYKDEYHKDPASSVDRGSEEIITAVIKREFPEHGLICEERGKTAGLSDYTWVIDPLDGTVNFLHNYRNFGVSIALTYRDETVVGVVYNPLNGEMFSAEKGGGTYLNGKRTRVSSTSKLGESLLAISFPYAGKADAFTKSLEYFGRLSRASQAIRRDGSTALALCNVACGRCDGFFVADNELWDYAAGVLIVAEAGGRVTDFKGEQFSLRNNGRQVLASNGIIHETMLQSLNGEI